MNLRDLITGAISKIQKTAQTASKGVPVAPVVQNLRNLVDTVKNGLTSIPFTIAQNKLNRQTAGKTPVTPQKYGSMIENRWNEFDKRNFQPQFESPNRSDYEYSNPQVANPSATRGIGDRYENIVAKSYYPTPNSNPALDTYKNSLLNSNILTPAAKQYLSKIPLTTAKFRDSALGMSSSANRPGRSISLAASVVGQPANFSPPVRGMPGGMQSVDPMVNKNKGIQDILLHEYLHQAPRIFPTKIQPVLNENTVNYYKNRWGEEYMRHKGSLQEEMFAERDMNPLNYLHIFNKPFNMSPSDRSQATVPASPLRNLLLKTDGLIQGAESKIIKKTKKKVKK